MSFAYTWKLRQNGTFIFNLNTHLLSGGSSPLHYIASDKFIENHTLLIELILIIQTKMATILVFQKAQHFWVH
jgi:hypothetical protein